MPPESQHKAPPPRPAPGGAWSRKRNGGWWRHQPPLSQLHGPPAGAASRWAGGSRAGAARLLPMCGSGTAPERRPFPAVPAGPKPGRFRAGRGAAEAASRFPFRSGSKPRLLLRPEKPVVRSRRSRRALSGFPLPRARRAPRCAFGNPSAIRPRPLHVRGLPRSGGQAAISREPAQTAGEPAALPIGSRAKAEAFLSLAALEERMSAKPKLAWPFFPGTIQRPKPRPVPSGCSQVRSRSSLHRALPSPFGPEAIPRPFGGWADQALDEHLPRPNGVVGCRARRSLRCRTPGVLPAARRRHSCPASTPKGERVSGSAARALVVPLRFLRVTASGYKMDAVTETESHQGDSHCG
jgi:hypothetical protein